MEDWDLDFDRAGLTHSLDTDDWEGNTQEGSTEAFYWALKAALERAQKAPPPGPASGLL